MNASRAGIHFTMSLSLLSLSLSLSLSVSPSPSPSLSLSWHLHPLVDTLALHHESLPTAGYGGSSPCSISSSPLHSAYSYNHLLLHPQRQRCCRTNRGSVANMWSWLHHHLAMTKRTNDPWHPVFAHSLALACVGLGTMFHLDYFYHGQPLVRQHQPCGRDMTNIHGMHSTRRCADTLVPSTDGSLITYRKWWLGRERRRKLG